MIEPLEHRLLLAASATLSGGVLTIEGTKRGDDILFGFTDNNRLQVGRDLANTKILGTFRLSRIDRIHAILKGGRDTIGLFDISIRSIVEGGPGSDILQGGPGKDEIRGGDGRDTIEGGEANDSLFGGPGDDVLRENLALAFDSGADDLSGGPGKDKLVYESRSQNLRVSLDGKANDGEEDEGDNVHNDVEWIVAGSGDDVLIGSGGADTLEGNSGFDILRGNGGGDRLIADDAQFDSLFGGAGDDTAIASIGDDIDEDIEETQFA
jgi:Ca2+-binding RTX toxin-like protein